MCDYVARYPEAVALRIIDAETVAEELVIIFSCAWVFHRRFDQGTNFMSHLLVELYRMIRVRPTPYHPQTDGLVKQFNQTLKHMLRENMRRMGTLYCSFIQGSTSSSIQVSPFLSFSMVILFVTHLTY